MRITQAKECTREDLAKFQPQHETLVGVDSDGCVFDTMTIKQKEFFHPLIVAHWDLAAIENLVRAAAEYINLRSVWRGRNRFTNLLLTFELLRSWPETRQAGVKLPDLSPLRAYCASGLALGNPTLTAEVARTNDPGLRQLLDWSLAVNRAIEAQMSPAPYFFWARESLVLMRQNSDLIVVSQTPAEALYREWRHHQLDVMVDLIAGQELGSKREHLQLTGGGRYAAGKVLMIGDAPGDMQAAREAGALFYPIVPGREEDSWQFLHDVAYIRFLHGGYDQAYEAQLIAPFNAALPDTMPATATHLGDIAHGVA